MAKAMGRWSHLQSWHRYPYTVGEVVGVEGWAVFWHANTGATTPIPGPDSYPTPAAAMSAAEAHGDANGWAQCDFRRTFKRSDANG